MTGNDEFLLQAYISCSKWDNWLSQNRNTRKTGLCELFCGWDTGDNDSSRLIGIPNDCSDHDASRYSNVGLLLYLAPDLFATVYGGRVALAQMAGFLGCGNEEAMWEEKADTIQKAIVDFCFDSNDIFFYDIDCNNKPVKIKGDVITRVLGEHVIDQNLFDQIFQKHINNPNEFWTEYPLPSISIAEPLFCSNFQWSAWAGASQALTALRAPRWMNYYHKPAHLSLLMKKWVAAIVRSSGFMQQMNPWTGE